MVNSGSKREHRLLAVGVIAWLSLSGSASAQQAISPHRATASLARNIGTSPIDTAWRASSRDRQSLWLLSTRRLQPARTTASQPVPFAPDVARFEVGSGWVSSSLDELIEAGKRAGATSLFLHGNDTDAPAAAEKGVELYRALHGGTQLAEGVQFVIWSWPSEIAGARVRDSAQANALRTNLEGYYLADYLSRVAPDMPINLCGYCTGARIVTGALHLLGGGTLAGLRLEPPILPRRNIQAVLLAAALANDWLLPGQPHGRALSQLERLVITVNATDPVLRWYPLTWGRGGPSALGMTGQADPLRLGTEQTKLVQLDLEPALHRRHSWQYYRSSPQVGALLRNELLSTSGSLVR